MKDFHDLYVLIESEQLTLSGTTSIIRSVFEHRETQIKFPLVFSVKELEGFQQFWTAHLRGLPQTHTMPNDFNVVISQINRWMAEMSQN